MQRCQRSRQSGYGLLETLVAIMLTSVVILALAGSLLTAIKSSEVADRVQRADSSLGSFTESLRAMPYPVTAVPGDCPGLIDYRDAWTTYQSAGDGWSPPPDVTLEIKAIEHWQPDGTDMGSYTGTCPSSGDSSSHRLTVEVEMAGRSRSAQVVVSQR